MYKLREVSISLLPRTSPRTTTILRKLGIETYFDLVNYFPSRYEDYSRIMTVAEIMKFNPIELPEQAGNLFSRGKVTIRGRVTKFDTIFTRRGLTMQKAKIEDNTGSIDLTWFNQRYLRQIIKPGIYISSSGKIRSGTNGNTFLPESYETSMSPIIDSIHSGRIVPIYPVTSGMSVKTLREKMYSAISDYSSEIEEFLPEKFIADGRYENSSSAYRDIHFPENLESAQRARERIAFDEIFTLQLSSQLIKQSWQKEKIRKKLEINKHIKTIDEFIHSLPFELTSAQKRILNDIFQDLGQEQPMNRLLQGDVGSGKTIVAALAAYMVHLNGNTTLYMAPTEILAQQHFESLSKTFKLLKEPIRISLITGKHKPSQNDLEESSVIIGTHALLSSKHAFNEVGLVIVDEQHKFGVAQRAQLKEKGIHPHLLSMTATPIPRTVALTLYGELNISIIDEMPEGRLPIKTRLVNHTKREKAYSWINETIMKEKVQAFIICPFVDESNTDTLKSIKAVTIEYERLTKEVFPHLRVGLLHGRLKSQEKEDVMSAFAKGLLDILVSTPVVEVGIDVPKATIILIEGAERFGLAQLHQLRGRVGRSNMQSYCFLFETDESRENNSRLRYFESEHSGFKLAYFDLKSRGSGTMFGTQQHGLSDIRIATLDNEDLIVKSLNFAKNFIQSYELDDFPELQRRVNALNMKRIARN